MDGNLSNPRNFIAGPPQILLSLLSESRNFPGP
jgi:hypothetical protein